MKEKSYEEKLAIAKQAYKKIIAAIDDFEQSGKGYCAHWDECISVEGELFQESDLTDKD